MDDRSSTSSEESLHNPSETVEKRYSHGTLFKKAARTVVQSYPQKTQIKETRKSVRFAPSSYSSSNFSSPSNPANRVSTLSVHSYALIPKHLVSDQKKTSTEPPTLLQEYLNSKEKLKTLRKGPLINHIPSKTDSSTVMYCQNSKDTKNLVPSTLKYPTRVISEYNPAINVGTQRYSAAIPSLGQFQNKPQHFYYRQLYPLNTNQNYQLQTNNLQVDQNGNIASKSSSTVNPSYFNYRAHVAQSCNIDQMYTKKDTDSSPLSLSNKLNTNYSPSGNTLGQSNTRSESRATTMYSNDVVSSTNYGNVETKTGDKLQPLVYNNPQTPLNSQIHPNLRTMDQYNHISMPQRFPEQSHTNIVLKPHPNYVFDQSSSKFTKNPSTSKNNNSFGICCGTNSRISTKPVNQGGSCS
ncbi:hypothetical protein BB560_003327 [Smittium megazygosporum]|uniref:Uncharacterized protein n=1 Tax=Smittium megazygosporum TaxID=133381 RepID=A0A2T9ZC99_9FUNG|nr:hypothetical protein BB560_003327 [Smittium megazygosporum]